MAIYNIELSGVLMNHRRTNHLWGGGNDTIKGACALQVGDRAYEPKSFNLGKRGKTGVFYPVGLRYDNVEITDPNALISFSYTVGNFGHSEGEKKLKQASTVLAVQGAAKLATIGGPWGMLGAGAILVANEFLKVLMANCDGPTAADAVTARPDMLLKLTSSGTWSLTRSYKGTGSPTGCGGTSNYAVTAVFHRPVAEGDLIRSFDDPTVFLIEGGFRRSVSDEPTFLSRWTYDVVRFMPQETVDAVPRGTDLPSIIGALPQGVNEGDLIKTSDDPPVYLIENGHKRWILEDERRLALWPDQQIKIVTPEALAAIPRGADFA